MALLEFRPEGIYCPQGDFHIDPWRRVDKALITHAHADHARWGMKHYLTHESSIPVMRLRLGQDISVQGVAYGQKIIMNGVEVSFHPAGHIPGSSQIRVAYQGETWVASGDYKLEDDGLSQAFEPVKCHTFITECTFGLPVYKWPKQTEVIQDINNWWRQNQTEGKVSFITAYSLGKAQRVIKNIDHSIGKVFTHGAVANTNEVLLEAGFDLPNTQRVTKDIAKEEFMGSLVIAPPAALNSSWMRKFKPLSIGIASGWMQLRGARRRRAADRGFVMSDHADWPGLLDAIKATGAENIITTHGYTDVFSRYLKEIGYHAMEEKTLFTGESIDAEAELEAQEEKA
jgi:putative mRNA 3-end processing factor